LFSINHQLSGKFVPKVALEFPYMNFDRSSETSHEFGSEAVAKPILRVGCAMWALKSWRGRYFPATTPPGRDLQAYRQWCTAAEGNTTFYGLPSAETVARWAADAPEGFRFLFKAPRTVTHDRRLRRCEAEMVEFLDRLAPLGPRAEPISIQLPATFGPSDLPALEAFLIRWSERCALAVEVRDAVFCQGGDDERRLNDLLAAHGAERVIIDTRAVFAGPRTTPEEQEAFARKPRLPVRPVAIGPNPVVRFVGQTAPEANPGWWAKWVPKVAQWIEEGRAPMVFIHTPDNLVAPELARLFHREVAHLVPDLQLLPDPEPVDPQLRLLE
jgi:uncharacterized protein YecE (DUF72 family)